MGVLNQNSIDRITIYFKDGRRIEFTDMMRVDISSRVSVLEVGNKFDIAIENSTVTEYTKRTSKRYKKNRKGCR